MDGLREILIALPPMRDDIYRRHQWVWRAMQTTASHGRDFIFAAISPHLVCVRSARLERGTPSAISEGAMRAQLVTVRRDGNRIFALDDGAVAEWVEGLLQQHGLRAETIEVVGSSVARGRKMDSATGVPIEIRLPVRDFRLNVRIEQRAKANLAWANGIGRGKRFGFGMLHRA